MAKFYERNTHDRLRCTYRSALGRQTSAPNKKAPISGHHYSPGLGRSLLVNTGAAAEALWGRAGNLIKQTYCVRADRSMWHSPLDAMHFHSGAGCCTAQSGPGAGVKPFTSSAAETKEQWERRSEHSRGQIINPGDRARGFSRKLRFFFFF